MKPKIIVADDSLTIQKVIKITLANEDFDLVECTDESNLSDLIQENNPIVALLDFNLSENKTGYDLTREIREMGVSKVLMLYGTFDTVDEKLLEHSGASAHIVKPFDGTKFISLCRQLVEDVSLEESDPTPSDIPEKIEEDFPEPIVDEEDQWVVNQPEVEDESEVEDEFVNDEVVSTNEMNSLEAGMQDWGIDVPGIIGEASEKQYALADIPPVIEEEAEVEKSVDNFVENDAPEPNEEIFDTPIKDPIELNPEEEVTAEIETITETVETMVEEEVLPDGDDLEYPDVDMIKSAVEAEVLEPKSKLISVAELAEDNTEESDFDDTEGTRTEEEVRDLEAQIADEIEGDFWSADEVIEDPSSAKKEEETEVESTPISEEQHVEQTVEEIPKEEQVDDEALASKDQVEAVKFDLGDIDQDKVLEMIEPIVEKMVQQRVQEILEKVAWEVIPDLSENLIKKELEKISETIINSKK